MSLTKTKSSYLLLGGLMAALSAAPAMAAELKPITEVVEPKGSFDPAKYGKVAVVAWNGPAAAIGVTAEEAEEFKAGNRAVLERYVREAASNGAEWVVTSEFSIVGYPDIPGMPPEEMDFRNPDEVRPYVETVPGPSTRHFAALAKELKVTIQIGLAEEDKATGKFYNAAVAIGPTGKILAKYRKINLYGLENRFLSPGDSITVYDGPFGKVGLIICADVYSGFPMDDYRKAGVNVLALSTSWASMNTGMRHFSAGAREAGAYVLAANQMYFPDSGVINPDGTTQSHIRQSNGVAYGYLPRVKAKAKPRARR